MTDRIIPLADAPAPASRGPSEPAPASAGAGRVRARPAQYAEVPAALVEAVSKVFDPEIPVNIYELGLIYNMDVDSDMNVQVRMTLTAPACPAAQTIPIDVERRVREVPGVKDVKVAVVWDPPWTRDKMSDAAKLTLGMH